MLVGELRLERYASIAGSDLTTSILEAWRGDDARGFARYRAAAEASGVKPPDTEPLAWGLRWASTRQQPTRGWR